MQDMSWNILGHAWAVALLQGHIRQGRLRQAYLFCGPPGVGRRTLALRLAQALNCPEPVAPAEPCGQCRTCQHIERQTHPDLLVVQPEESGSLKVEQVRALQHDLMLKPYERPYRVALLLNLERATVSAQNALLKTLEEPPEHAILLLTSDVPENVLPTIVSRCEVLRLRPLPLNTLQTALQERWGLPVDEARTLAHLAGGRPGYALRLHADPELRQQHLHRVQDALMLLSQRRLERFQYAEALAKDRDALRTTLQAWVTLWRDILLCAGGSNAPLTNLACEAEIRALAEKVGWQVASRCLATLEQALDHLDANLNPRLLGEIVLLDWPYL